MDIRVLTLCDGAYNYNGKLTIVGTSDNLKVLRVPCIASVGLAIKLVFPASEFGKKNVEITFKRSSDGQQVLPPLQFQTSIESKGQEGYIVLAANINGLNIQETGKHVVEVNVDGNVVILPFLVIQ